MPLSLPPLNALRAFEAAARAGSYVAAAEELGVSPAAVSQQVRNLEEFLGKKLFMRFNNRVSLTDAGQVVFAGASDALQSISALTEQVTSGATRSRLVVSVITSVAERWLEPRLAAFVLREKALRIELRVESDPVDFARHNIDLRICYGTNLYPEMIMIPLLQDEVLPLCSPAYLERNQSAKTHGMDGVPDDDLIHTSWGPSFVSHPTWHAWFAKSGIARPNDRKGYQVGMSSLALDLARDGVGVALGQKMMAGGDMAAGRLVPMSTIAIELGHPYSLVHPRSKSRKAGLQSLIDWLTKDAG
ncbi:MAG TPA: LysR substrate-binding domain-containing protein [Dongiaceae bacterium]|jgi:LysR family glycine cleavage system transcriptional activator|nr:LysR substrate-binding domain-containing protein [Dongiaceae bacterium]